ncbi:MAG: alpha/beta fold hydrolase [Planctomycetia bacterium]|nr:alpha/beta fold hydrolase [Planctomycetia bacterium]
MKKSDILPTSLCYLMIFLSTGTDFTLYGTEGPEKLSGDNMYHPGTLLIFQGDSWKVVTSANMVDPARNIYVLIHGAYGRAEKAEITEQARAIRQVDRQAILLAVDWSYWSGVDESRMEEIVETAASDYVAELMFSWGAELISGVSPDYGEIFRRHFEQLTREVVFHVIPIRQAEAIPTVADRLVCQLFGRAGDPYTSETYDRVSGEDRKFRSESLGLDPRKVHLIGHSHGAHVAGLTGVYAQNRGWGTVKRITALDPSVELCHTSPENLQGGGWDRNAAGFVDVYRTSHIFSANRLYGDVNTWFVHPVTRNLYESLSSGGGGSRVEILAGLAAFFATDVKSHAMARDVFTGLVREGGQDFLRLSADDYPESAASRWNEVFPDRD